MTLTFSAAFDSAAMGSAAALVLDTEVSWAGAPAPSWRPLGGMALTLSLSYRLDPRGAGC